ncbi:hypothetical protein [Gorillibacterium sp. CAU 1737]|uniref:hypothetical protein n=1 Tax=Gorillibacterium sp. CAU 1737 TaxID=3140362 RepID=UPI00325FECE1
MRKIIGDLYNRLFQVQASSPGAVIDYDVWNRINEALPEDYILPDPRTAAELLKP